MKIADRIQRLRKNRGISQEELADKIGVSRQAVSKWESEQSLPDIEKIILLSNYFDVSTDYLLKGTELPSKLSEKKADARIFATVGSALNFIGLFCAIIIWMEKQTPVSVAVGLILMALGCTIFAIGLFIGRNTKLSSCFFWMVNIWFLSLIPISCAFNCIQGITGGFWWTFTPLPQLGNSFLLYGLCWLFYLLLCISTDIAVLTKLRRQIPDNRIQEQEVKF